MENNSDRRSEIKRLLALRDTEGLTYRELSEHSGIPLGTLNWWAHRLRHEVPDDDGFEYAGEFELDHSGGHGLDAAADARLLHSSGLVIELRGELADRILNRLLRDVLP